MIITIIINIICTFLMENIKKCGINVYNLYCLFNEHGLCNDLAKVNVNYWYFINYDKLLDCEYKFNGKLLDIATAYCGMGHYKILSYIPATDKFCFRIDGGSNDYMRLDNYNSFM